MDDRDIVVIGAGPTGLGAGHRLRQLGHDDWVVLEAADRVGGLASSYTDAAGFTWDVGGHVLFSHYDHYDAVVDDVLGEDWTAIERQAWIWMEGRFVRYPFQHHLGALDRQTVFDCVFGAVEAAASSDGAPPRTFVDWVLATMGRGIADHFMLPYNRKVWATPLERMSADWIAERVPPVDVERLLRSVLLHETPSRWGPNRTFRYPLRGGTGAIFEGIGRFLDGHLRLASAAVHVDPRARVVTTSDGRSLRYRTLLSTMPLTRLVTLTDGVPDAVRHAAEQLEWAGGHFVGIGVDRPADTDRCWVYFPEHDVPFYRVTYLSNYSPYLTARPGQLSLLAEISTSPSQPVDPETVVDEVVDGLMSTGLLTPDDVGATVSRWHLEVPLTYPVPTLGRDAALATVHGWLREHGVWSRGRFGAWRYEIGNMDHSFMQGAEFVDAVLHGAPEPTWEG